MFNEYEFTVFSGLVHFVHMYLGIGSSSKEHVILANAMNGFNGWTIFRGCISLVKK